MNPIKKKLKSCFEGLLVWWSVMKFRLLLLRQPASPANLTHWHGTQHSNQMKSGTEGSKYSNWNQDTGCDWHACQWDIQEYISCFTPLPYTLLHTPPLIPGTQSALVRCTHQRTVTHRSWGRNDLQMGQVHGDDQAPHLEGSATCQSC